MGQRTETFVTYINAEGKKTNNVYYNSWGIGRVQLNAIFGAFLGQIGQPRFDLDGMGEMRNDNNWVLGENPNDYDFTDINTLKELFKKCDNNNGGIVCIVDDEKQFSQIGFILGCEECYNEDEEPFSRFVSFDEWREKVGKPYVDDDYAKIVEGMFKHFNFQVLGA